jgi:hypothetical protein
MPSQKELQTLIKLRSSYNHIAHTPDPNDGALGENPLFQSPKSYDQLKLISDDEFFKGNIFEPKRNGESEAQYQHRLQQMFIEKNNQRGHMFQASVHNTNEQLLDKFKTLVGNTYYAEYLMNIPILRNDINRQELNTTFAHFRSKLIERYGKNLDVKLIARFIGEFLNPHYGLANAISEETRRKMEEYQIEKQRNKELKLENERELQRLRQQQDDGEYYEEIVPIKKEKSSDDGTQAKKKRGRPKNSRNKPKDAAV